VTRKEHEYSNRFSRTLSKMLEQPIHMSGDLPPATKPVFSKTILFFTIMLTFGSHYCFDAPSVMEKQIQEVGYPFFSLKRRNLT
jgi:hypothetical protein